MSGDWRPFEPSRDTVQAAAQEAERNTCNRHKDCVAADERARAQGLFAADHCHDECCEECFGY